MINNILESNLNTSKNTVLKLSSTLFFSSVESYLRRLLVSIFSNNEYFSNFIANIAFQKGEDNIQPILERTKLVSAFPVNERLSIYKLSKRQPDRQKRYDKDFETFNKELQSQRRNHTVGEYLNFFTIDDIKEVVLQYCNKYSSTAKNEIVSLLDMQALYKSIDPTKSEKAASLFYSCLKRQNLDFNYDRKKIINSTVYAEKIRNIYTHDTGTLYLALCHSFVDNNINIAWGYATKRIYDFLLSIRISEDKCNFKSLDHAYKESQKILNYKFYDLNSYISENITKTDLIRKINKYNLNYNEEYHYVFCEDFERIVEEIRSDKKTKYEKIEISQLQSILGISLHELTTKLKGEFTDKDGKIDLNPNALEEILDSKRGERKEKHIISSKYAIQCLKQNLKKISDVHSLEGVKGNYTIQQVLEICKTHTVILDKSIFMNEDSRKLIRKLIFEYPDIPFKFLIDKKVAFNLYSNKLSYDAQKKTGYVPEELQEYDKAYRLLQDTFVKQGYGKIAGELNTGLTFDESLLQLVSTMADHRVSVWYENLDDRNWSAELNHYENPFIHTLKLKSVKVGANEMDFYFSTDRLVVDTSKEEYITRLYDYACQKYMCERKTNESDKKKTQENLDEKQKKYQKSKTDVSTVFHGFSSDPVLKPITEEKIMLNQPVKIGDTLKDETGNEIKLESYLSEELIETEGGEGTVYKTDKKGQVAKIYHTRSDKYTLTTYRMNKIKTMVENNPQMYALAWPTHMLFNSDNKFVGYLMPEAPEDYKTLQSSVEQIDKPSIQKGLLKNWNRYTLSIMCCKICQVFCALHKKNIFVGDVNMGNIMVDINDPKKIFFIDCDSYQFDGYSCPVGTPEFTSPAMVKRGGNNLNFGRMLRTEAEENFSIAMLLFKTIMMNINPYKQDGIQDMADINKAKMEYNFPYTFYNRAKIDSSKDYHVMWMNLLKALRDDFTAVFKEKKDISPQQFEKDFYSFSKVFEKYPDRDRSLEPTLYFEYDNENPNYKLAVCKRCGNTFNYPKYEKEPKYCNKCNAFLKKMDNFNGKEPNKFSEKMRCPGCLETYYVNVARAEMIHKRIERFYCPSCSEIIEAKCDVCGKVIKMKKGFIKQLRRNKKQVLCKECKEKYFTSKE